MPPRRTSAWTFAVLAAFAGFLVALLLGMVGVRPAGWAVLAGVVTAAVAAAALAGRGGVPPATVLGFTLACLLIEWPILGLVYAWVRYETTGQAIGQ